MNCSIPSVFKSSGDKLPKTIIDTVKLRCFYIDLGLVIGLGGTLVFLGVIVGITLFI